MTEQTQMISRHEQAVKVLAAMRRGNVGAIRQLLRRPVEPYRGESIGTERL